MIEWLAGLPEWVKTALDLLSVVATAAAAVLAAVTIRQAKKQAKASQEALRSERVAEFRLGLLKEIAHLNLSTTDYPDAEIRLMASMLPAQLIPFTRAVAGLDSTPAAERSLNKHRHGILTRAGLREEIFDELLQAVEATVTE